MKIKIKNKIIEILDKELLITKNVNTYKIDIEIDDDFKRCTNLYVVYKNENVIKKEIIGPDFKSTIPHEVLDKTGTLYMGFFGTYLDGDVLKERHVTNLDKLTIVEGSYYEEATNTEEIDVTILEKYLAEMNLIYKTYLEELNKISTDISNMKNSVETSEQNAKTSEDNAKASETSAQNSANKASQSETNVVNIEKNINAIKEQIDTIKTNMDGQVNTVNALAENAATQATKAENQAKISIENATATSADKTAVSEMKSEVEGLKNEAKTSRDEAESFKYETLEAKEVVKNSLENERIESEKRYAKAVDTEVITVEEFAQVELDEDGYMEDVVVEASEEITQETHDSTANILYTQEKYWEQGTLDGSNGSNKESTTRIRNKDFIAITELEKYYISLEDSSYSFVNIAYYTSSKSFLINQGGISSVNNLSQALITIPEKCAYFRMIIKKNDTDEIKPSEISTIKPMVVKGITKIDFVEGYPVMPSLNYPSEFQNMLKEVDFSNSKKNIFDLTKYPFTARVAYNVGGTQVYWTGYSGILGYFPVQENFRYTFSNSLNKNIYYGLVFYDKHKNVLSWKSSPGNKIETPAHCRYIRFSIGSETLPEWVQITPGEVVLPYEPYQGNTSKLTLPEGQFLGNFKGYSNAIDKGVLKGQLKEVVLTGSESIDINTNYSFGNVFYYEPDNCFSTTSRENSNIICNYLKGVTYNQLISGIEGVTYNKDNNGKILFFIEELKTATVEQFKAKLKELYDAGTPVKILYVAQTEEQQELSQENLQVVNSLQTYQGENNISTPEAKLSFKANQGIPSYVDKVVDEKLIENNLSEREISDDKYARALKKEVSETDFTQVFAENEKIEGLEIYGEELTQETREGYNLLNTLAAKKVGYTQTINGITFTILADGGILINGTATGTAIDFYIRGSWDYETPLFTLDKGKTYTLKISDTNIGCLLALVKTKSSPFNTGSKGTLTLDNDLGITGVFVRVNNGTTLNNVTVYPLLYEGTEDKPYEQYGAMPSLDFPSEVHTMNDRVNLFDKDNVVTGYINKNGEIIYTSTDCTSDYIKVEPDTNYSRKITNGNAYFDKDKNIISYDYVTSIKTPSNCAYIRITVPIANKEAEKLEKGSKSTSYTPYGQSYVGLFDIGRNILNTFIEDMTRIGLTLKAKADGSIHVSGVPTATYTSIKRRTVYLSKKVFDTKNLKIGLNYGKSKELLKDSSFNPFLWLRRNSTEINTSINIHNLSNLHGIATDVSIIEFGIEKLEVGKQYDEDIYISVEIGYELPTKFEPYQENNTLIPFLQDTFTGAIGSHKDTIKEVDGRWKVEKKLEEYAMTGTENLTLSGNTTDTILVSTFVLSKTGINDVFKSTHFKQNKSVVINFGNIYNNGRNIRFCLDKNIYPDINSFKAKLTELYNAGTPVEIYYVLATPDYIDLPDETQEILNGIKLRLGLNNFSIDVGTFSYIYNKSLSKELEEKDQLIEELASRILALENATLNLAEGE